MTPVICASTCVATRKGYRSGACRLLHHPDDAGFVRLAGEAEKKCPVSKVLDATITLDAKLV